MVLKGNLLMKKCKNIEEVRFEIDALDEQIITLIAKRENFVMQAAKFKKDSDDVKAPQRVEQVISKVKKLAIDLNADPEIIEIIYRNMINAFIERELLEHKRIVQW